MLYLLWGTLTMEMNIHIILLTGHFNNLKLDTQEHSFVTDIRKILQIS